MVVTVVAVAANADAVAASVAAVVDANVADVVSRSDALLARTAVAFSSHRCQL